MSLSESERRTIVTRELEKAQRTFDDAIFFFLTGSVLLCSSINI